MDTEKERGGKAMPNTSGSRERKKGERQKKLRIKRNEKERPKSGHLRGEQPQKPWEIAQNLTNPLGRKGRETQ